MNTNTIREKSLKQVIEHSKFLLSLMNADGDACISDSFRQGVLEQFAIPAWMHGVKVVRPCSPAEEDALVYDFVVGKQFVEYISGIDADVESVRRDFVIPLVAKNLTFASMALVISFGYEVQNLPVIVVGTHTVRISYFDNHLHVCVVSVEDMQREATTVARQNIKIFLQNNAPKPEQVFDLSKWFPDIHSVTTH
jgi:hypothetical protein